MPLDYESPQRDPGTQMMQGCCLFIVGLFLLIVALAVLTR